MECALEAIGKQWARQDRKRRRGAEATPSRSEDSESTEPVETAELHEALSNPSVQKRLYESVRGLIRDQNDRRLNTGATFVARSVYAMFMAVQAVHAFPYGAQWAGLLYICFYAVSNEFSDAAHTPPLEHSEGLSLRDLRTLTRYLGMAPEAGGQDETLMKTARKWERSADEDLCGAMMSVWRVVRDTPRVRMTVDSLLWPCQRAHLLFDNTHQR